MSKMIIITTYQFKKLMSEGKEKKLIIPRNSFNNPFTMSESLRNNVLMEGYFMTYPMDKVKKYLEKRYGDGAEVDIVKGDNNELVFLIRTADSDFNQEIIDKDLSLCGYYPSFVEKKSGIRDIQYEPRHQKPVNKIVYNKKYLYHLTTKSHLPKIMEIGLCPKTNNKKFKYPDRIYFFLQKPSIKEINDIIEQFEPYEKNINDKHVLLQIDVKDLNIDFFFDPNAEKAVYTKDNIPSNNIQVIEEYNK